MTQQLIQQEEVNCSYCQAIQPNGYRFCSACGKENRKVTLKVKKERQQFTFHLQSLAAYSFIVLGVTLFAALTNDSFVTDVVWTVFFALISLIFLFINTSSWRLFRLPVIRLSPLCLTVTLCLLSAIVVTITATLLNELIFGPSFNSEFELYYLLDHPIVYALLLSAVMPAIFEEIAFRGYVFDNLKVIGGKNAAIFGSAFLFALAHLSLLSLFWIFPFGLFLAYMRNKYQTLYYGILGHFIHNASVVLLDYYEIL